MREDDLQKQVASYLDALGLLWCHVPNEGISGRKGVRYGAKMKSKGLKSGVPDCLIFTPSEPFTGLALELKVGRNTLTKNQKKWLLELSILGWECKYAYSFEDAKQIIDEYLKNRI